MYNQMFKLKKENPHLFRKLNHPERLTIIDIYI